MRKRIITIMISLILIATIFIPIKMGYKIKVTNINTQSPVTQSLGNNLYVGGSGIDNYTTIQDAIDNASSGDTIFVYNGTYYENVIVNKSVNIVGENRNTTFINGNGSDKVVYITSNKVNISGFTIQNSGSQDIAGLYLISNYNIIYNNNFSLNNANGLRFEEASNNVIYRNNICNNQGEGIGIFNSSDNNIIYHNNIFFNSVNAHDECNNTWYNATLEEGNYWDDYNGIDEDFDRIGDTPYNISGGSNQDLYPLMTPYGLPHADFTYNANGKNVFFDASSSYDYDGNIISYDWDFGDGEIGTGMFVNYTYCCFNTYNVKLIVTDNDELTNETTKIITIFNDPPLSPNNPEPENNSIDVDINTILSWTCIDPNGDPLTYDVYFEKDDSTPDNLVSNNQSYLYFDPPDPLEYNSHYYWKIVAWDSYNAQATGQIWNFITGEAPNNPPYQPSNPDPPNGTFNMELIVEISWICSDLDNDVLVYDIYLEADDKDPDVLVSDDQNETTFNTGTLQYKTTCYWQVIVKDEHGASTPGPVWHFTTKPEKNDPPDAPIINGPAIESIGKSIKYTFVAEDPDNDDVFYEIDWGDGNVDSWIGPYSSNTIITSSHRWKYWGLYTIRARSKDIYGSIGDWGELIVTMPRGKIVNINLIFNLLARLSIQFPILHLFI